MGLFQLSGFITAITTFSLAIIVLLHDPKQKINQTWSLFCFAVSTWGVWSFVIPQLSNGPAPETLAHILYIGTIFIPIFFIHFVFVVLNLLKNRAYVLQLWTIYAVGISILASSFIAPHQFIARMDYVFNEFYDIRAGIIFTAFFIFFITLVTYSHLLLIIRYATLREKLGKLAPLFFIATILGFGGGLTAFFINFGIDLYPYGNFLLPLNAILLTYVFFRGKFLNVRVVITEVLMILSWILLAIYLFVLAPEGNLYIKIAVCALTVILGMFGVRAALQEIDQRAKLAEANVKLDDLNQNLEQKVAEQTKKIWAMYEVEKRARIELERLDTSKTDFILMTQHYLRTPLTVINGYNQTLESERLGALTPEVKGVVEKMAAQLQKLIKLINDLATITQISVGKIILQKENVSLVELLDEVCAHAGPDAQKKEINLALTCSGECKTAHVFADKTRLREAIDNVVDNAIKYTPRGSVAVAAELGAGTVRIAIKDTGIGIASDDLKSLFSRAFERGADAKDIYAIGQGLGLMVSKNIIEAHGGTISAVSEGKDKGSTFIIELPLGAA